MFLTEWLTVEAYVSNFKSTSSISGMLESSKESSLNTVKFENREVQSTIRNITLLPTLLSELRLKFSLENSKLQVRYSCRRWHLIRKGLHAIASFVYFNNIEKTKFNQRVVCALAFARVTMATNVIYENQNNPGDRLRDRTISRKI